MLKHLFFSSFLIFTLISCEKSGDNNIENGQLTSDRSPNYMIVGDTINESVQYQNLNILVQHGYRCSPSECYFMDLDSNGVDDFKICIYHCYGGDFSSNECYIESLHSESKVMVNDTIDSPQILHPNDTIQNSQQALSGLFALKSFSAGLDSNGTSYQIHGGNWELNQVNYLGMVLEGTDFTYYAWLKLELQSSTEFYLYDTAILKVSL